MPREPEREREPEDGADTPAAQMPARPEAESRLPARPAANALSRAPAHWLADIRARAPHLLEDGGLLSGSVSASEAPAAWPHGPGAVAPASYREGSTPPLAGAAYPDIEPRAPAAADVEPPLTDASVRAPAPTFEAPDPRPAGEPAYPPPPTTPAPPTLDWPDAPRRTTPTHEALTTPQAKVHPEPSFPDPIARPPTPAPGYPSPPPALPPWEAWPRFSVADRPAEDREGPVWGNGRSLRPAPVRFPALPPERVDDEPAWGVSNGPRDGSEPRYAAHSNPWPTLLEPGADPPPDARALERRLARRARLDREQRGR
jgi:hypothetical protein